VTSFDNINTLKKVADVVNQLAPESNCYATVRADDQRAMLVIQHGDVFADVYWNSPLYHHGIVRLIEILAQKGYVPVLTLRHDALCHCILDLTINGEPVSSGDCTMGVAIMGAFYAISGLDPEVVK